jgi:glycosyltransferase involved in cell wall biosynthesis
MPDRPRILWLHTQPEHYHNCMMDDLARREGGEYEYIAAFSSKGQGWYTESPTPKVAQTVFLKPRAGFENRQPTFSARFHEDWRAQLYPLHFDAAIVAGYGWRTHREVIRDCRRRGIPVAMFSDSNLRSQRGTGMKARLKRAFKRRMLAGLIADVDLLLTANRLGVAYWRYFGAPSSKITVCPYYADYTRVALARESVRSEVLSRINLAPEARYLYSAARLVPAKGLDLMIAAFINAGLAAKGWHYVIAGVGPLEAALKAQAGSLLGKNIHFVGFQQPSENLALTVHSDLFVLPSVYEPHGIVIQEALAAGTPVLASNVCGAAYDLVKPGLSGELFTSGSVQRLQGKLVDLLADSARLAGLRITARSEFDRWLAGNSPLDVVNAAVGRLLALRSEKVAAAGIR